MRLLVFLLLVTATALAAIANVSRSSEPAVASGVADIAAGTAHSCAAVTGEAKCWGANASGQLGDGSTMERHAPVPVVSLGNGVLDIEAGNEHTCALLTGDSVKCWGRNVEGQLGNASNAQSDEPVAVSGLTSGVVAIATGANHSCALTSDGDVEVLG